MPLKNIPRLLIKSEHVTNAQQAERLKICRACPNIRKRVGKEVCLICRCFLHLKTELKVEECPILKWKKI